MSKEQLINTLCSIEQFFKGKDMYERSPYKFAELYLGSKLLPYQKLLLKTLYAKNNIITNILSRQKQKELNLTTKAKLTQAISGAVNGKKVLFMSPNKDTDKYINYITNFIELNKSMFEENDIMYVVEGNIIKFNTDGSIEFN